MKSTGRSNSFDIINESPEDPFIRDLNSDLKIIDGSNNKKEARSIKKLLINEILKTI